jgi:hypothetical protein
MDETKVNVQDSIYTKIMIINNIKIRTNRLSLFNSISLGVSLFADNSLVENKTIDVTGEDYNNWGNDDQYIVNFVLNKLGLTPAQVSNIRVTTQ